VSDGLARDALDTTQIRVQRPGVWPSDEFVSRWESNG
jgi:hypothetical protein